MATERMTPVQVPVESLLPHPKHDEMQEKLPAMQGKRWDKFLNDISERGILSPVLASKRTGENVIVDGHQRVHAALELGLETIPVVFGTFGSDVDEYVAHVAANTHRRHLNTAQYELAIQEMLKHFSGYSNRVISEELSVSRHAVAAQRKKLEQKGEIEPQTYVKRSSGGEFPSTVQIETNRERVHEVLVDHPELSDNAIAAQVGVSDHMVKHERAELIEQGLIPRLERLQGADGKMRPAGNFEPGRSGRARSSKPSRPERKLRAVRQELERAITALRNLSDEDRYSETLRPLLLELHILTQGVKDHADHEALTGESVVLN